MGKSNQWFTCLGTFNSTILPGLKKSPKGHILLKHWCWLEKEQRSEFSFSTQGADRKCREYLGKPQLVWAYSLRVDVISIYKIYKKSEEGALGVTAEMEPRQSEGTRPQARTALSWELKLQRWVRWCRPRARLLVSLMFRHLDSSVVPHVVVWLWRLMPFPVTMKDDIFIQRCTFGIKPVSKCGGKHVLQSCMNWASGHPIWW